MANKKKFPDLTGDGKVTRADVLKGRGVFKNGGKSKTREKVDGGTVTKTKRGDATIKTKRRADGSLIKGKLKTKDGKIKRKYRKDGTLKKEVKVTRDEFGSKVRRTTKMDKKGKIKRNKRIGGSPQMFQGDGFEAYAFGGVAPKLGTAKKFPSDSTPFESHLSKFYRSNK
jgi:hypothetical protein